MLIVAFPELQRRMDHAGLKMSYDGIDEAAHFSVYHMHEWHCGYDPAGLLRVKPDGTLPQQASFEGPRRVFYADLNEMMCFLFELLDIFKEDHIILAPFFHYYPFVLSAEKNDIYQETLDFLHRNHLRKDSRAGVELSLPENRDVMTMAVEGAFRDVTQLCIFAKKAGFLIAPNHHFEVVFYAANTTEIEHAAVSSLKKHPNLCFFKN